MIAYLFILIAIIFFSIGVFIDNFLINSAFKDTKALLFYSNITNLLFIPLLWIFGLPKILPNNMIFPILIVGFAQAIYLYPYFKALKETDTSIISALFNMGKIFVPLLAWLIVNERLSLIQYIGFILIIISSFFLTYKGELKVNKALIYMIITSLILAINSTITKYALESVDWITVITWSAVVSTIITIIIGTLFYRKEISKTRKIYFKNIWRFIINEFVTFIAIASMIFAITKMPITIVQGLLAAQPVLMILIAYFAHKFLPKYFKEDFSLKNVLKKTVFFIIIIIGIILSVM